MAKFKLDDQEFFYTYNGVKSLPLLLLIHGAGGTHLYWPGEVRRLRETAVIALDLPGHGQSDPPGHDSIEAYADFVERFIKRLSSPPTIITGHSMGGAIAQEIGRRQPAWLDSLILVGTAPKMPVSSAILDNILSDFPGTADFITRYGWGYDSENVVRGMGRKFLLEESPEVVLGDFIASNNFDMRENLSEIEVPTLVIGGAFDKMTPYKNSIRLADQIPNAELITFKRAGHMLMLEEPERVALVIRNFVQARINVRQKT